MHFNGRSTDQWGNVIFNTDGLIDHLMRGNDFTSDILAEGGCIEQYNRLCRELDHPEDQITEYVEPNSSIEEWDNSNQENWITPEPFKSMDTLEFLLEKCSTEKEVQRVLDEWALFEEREMIPVLRFLIFLIDNFRTRKVVWGVGRGSSVASYILFLIGVHKVNSIDFDLDIREFLK